MKKFIAVFDSGLGGLTVLADLRRSLPRADLVYLGDSKFAPYGEKSQEEILRRCKEIVGDFVSEGAAVVLIACNTATSAAVEELRRSFSIPIIGMEPALKPAVQANRGGRILVLATPYTIQNDKYHRLQARFAAETEVAARPAPELVRLVEQGEIEGKAVEQAIRRAVGEGTFESVVLGCTHFLYLKKALRQVLGPLEFFDGNEGTIRRVREFAKDIAQSARLEIRSSRQDSLETAGRLFGRYQVIRDEELRGSRA